MKVACLMMQKNEALLAEPWIKYYASLFGIRNLYVYDNGSTDSRVVAALEKAQLEGANVDWSRNQRRDFERKGRIIGNQIKWLDANNPYDFYFPLDCDEFLATQTKDGVCCDREALLESLSGFAGAREVLMISKVLGFNPCYRNMYRKHVGKKVRKCFFATDRCESLDIGFHRGRSKLSDEELKTPVVHYHLHNKPYTEYQRSTREKLSGRVDDFSAESLLRHGKKPGGRAPMISRFMLSREDYRRHFMTMTDLVREPALIDAFDRLGIDSTPFFELPIPAETPC